MAGVRSAAEDRWHLQHGRKLHEDMHRPQSAVSQHACSPAQDVLFVSLCVDLQEEDRFSYKRVKWCDACSLDDPPPLLHARPESVRLVNDLKYACVRVCVRACVRARARVTSPLPELDVVSICISTSASLEPRANGFSWIIPVVMA
jgi:hypothetical protein